MCVCIETKFICPVKMYGVTQRALVTMNTTYNRERRRQLVGELGVDAEGAVRFSLPSTLKLRYTPAGSTDPLASVPAGEGQQV